MQTFLPYEDYKQTAQCLDYRRLGKQRIECKQILNALSGNSKGWTHHPATLMWKRYECELCQYAISICKEWIARGYKDQQLTWFIKENENYYTIGPPAWLGSIDFHLSHRSNLLRKDFVFYNKYNWNVPNDMEYVWPSEQSKLR